MRKDSLSSTKRKTIQITVHPKVSETHALLAMNQFPTSMTDSWTPSLDELELGPLLGEGSFCQVFRVMVRRDQLQDNDSDQLSTPQSFAVKRLTCPQNPSHLAILKTEARILQRLPFQHPNIICYHRISPEQGFLVMDELSQTLGDAIVQWKKQRDRRFRSRSPPRKIFKSFVNRTAWINERRLAQAQRIRAALLGLARAMEFLHKHKIVFRDLKPDNCGFDHHGNIRLFDFGHARYIGDQDKVESKVAVGTYRYMSPEIFLLQPYGLSSDMHSYAMLFWEVCCLEVPYANAMTKEGIQDMMIKGKIRPSLGRIASPAMRDLLKQSWIPEPIKRPDFSWIVQEIEKELQTASHSQQ